ncbi:FeoB-associated Cys-rich membrane protein [Poseidonibacter lekithochrous]|nr:FeoB-associated Cys-rich membrane protein [Poseidonibacter lekithochrous]
MSTEELIFTLIIFALAVFYIYKSLFKKNSCGGSCGCETKLSNNKK